MPRQKKTAQEEVQPKLKTAIQKEPSEDDSMYYIPHRGTSQALYGVKHKGKHKMITRNQLIVAMQGEPHNIEIYDKTKEYLEENKLNIPCKSCGKK